MIQLYNIMEYISLRIHPTPAVNPIHILYLYVKLNREVHIRTIETENVLVLLHDTPFNPTGITSFAKKRGKGNKTYD